MKKTITAVLLTAALLFNPALVCKYDRLHLLWYGQTRVVYSQLEYLCKCAAGHSYWLDKSDCSE